MTAPSRRRRPTHQCIAVSGAIHPGSGPEAVRLQQLLQALTTGLYLSTVSGGVVALAFIGQVAQVGKAFFDSVPHSLLPKAVAHHTSERWVLLCISRWLSSPARLVWLWLVQMGWPRAVQLRRPSSLIVWVLVTLMGR